MNYRSDDDVSLPVRSRREGRLTGEAVTGQSYWTLRRLYSEYLRKHPTGRLTITLGDARAIRDGRIAPSK
jgi:hypothetical protein